MFDKNRKRGIRIAQKATYKHHSRDNSRWKASQGRTHLSCYECEGWKNLTCTMCARLLYHMKGGDALDYDMSEYLNASVDVPMD